MEWPKPTQAGKLLNERLALRPRLHGGSDLRLVCAPKRRGLLSRGVLSELAWYRPGWMVTMPLTIRLGVTRTFNAYTISSLLAASGTLAATRLGAALGELRSSASSVRSTGPDDTPLQWARAGDREAELGAEPDRRKKRAVSSILLEPPEERQFPTAFQQASTAETSKPVPGQSIALASGQQLVLAHRFRRNNAAVIDEPSAERRFPAASPPWPTAEAPAPVSGRRFELASSQPLVLAGNLRQPAAANELPAADFVDALFERAQLAQAMPELALSLLPEVSLKSATDATIPTPDPPSEAVSPSWRPAPGLAEPAAAFSRADVERIAERVSSVLEQRARLERERGGRY